MQAHNSRGIQQMLMHCMIGPKGRYHTVRPLPEFR